MIILIFMDEKDESNQIMLKHLVKIGKNPDFVINAYFYR